MFGGCQHSWIRDHAGPSLPQPPWNSAWLDLPDQFRIDLLQGMCVSGAWVTLGRFHTHSRGGWASRGVSILSPCLCQLFLPSHPPPPDLGHLHLEFIIIQEIGFFPPTGKVRSEDRVGKQEGEALGAWVNCFRIYWELGEHYCLSPCF